MSANTSEVIPCFSSLALCIGFLLKAYNLNNWLPLNLDLYFLPVFEVIKSNVIVLGLPTLLTPRALLIATSTSSNDSNPTSRAKSSIL